MKTATKNIKFTGGTRGGIDREYKSGVKEYTQSTKTADVVIGVTPLNGGEDGYDLYFIPTRLIEEMGQKSISISKLEDLKFNYEMIDKCKDYSFILEKGKEYGLINKS